MHPLSSEIVADYNTLLADVIDVRGAWEWRLIENC